MKIPMIRQGTDYTCGAAALQSVILYYYRNERGYQWLCENTLSKDLNATEKNGTDYWEIVNLALTKGLHAEAKFNMTVDSLVDAINQKKLVICNIQAWADNPPVDYKTSYNSGHYVVAIGYDENNIYFMDPWTVGNYTYISRKELPARWHDKNRNKSGNEIKTEKLGILLWKNAEPEFNPDIITEIK